MSVQEAYRWCEGLAREHYENFPVASRLIPAALRPHVAAIYAFSRTADDFADEPQWEGQRLERLARWGKHLTACYNGEGAPGDADEAEATAVFTALAHTIRAFDLPRRPLEDLLTAFRMDVTIHRYATFDDLLHYCRHSANPVGRLILRLFGRDDPALTPLSDHLCTALQLTNFWQDLAIDLRKGRVYIPQEDLSETPGASEDLRERCPSPAVRAVLRRQAERTAAIFDGCRELPQRVGGRLGWELRLVWLGGREILRRLEEVGYDVFHRRPSLSKTDWLRLGWKSLRRP